MKQDVDTPTQTEALQPQPHPVKVEMLDVADNGNDTADSDYLLQQQLPYEGSDLPTTESHVSKFEELCSPNFDVLSVTLKTSYLFI